MERARLLALLDAFHSTHVVVVGDLMLDRFVYGSVSRISPEAPIPVMAIDRSVAMPGGAANVARNIAMMGAKTTLVGAVGCDEAAAELRAQLGALPSVVTHLVEDSSRPTSLKVRFVAERQQVLRTDVESSAPVSQEIAARVVQEVKSALDTAQIVVLSDYAKGVLSDPVVQELVGLARAAGREVLVDPKSVHLARYRGATVLTPNRAELQRASGRTLGDEAELTEAARAYLASGTCRDMLVTRGGEGMTLVEGGGAVTHLRAFTREVFDVSGAGDTVIAALALGLAAGGSTVEAATLANVAAGIVVGKPGTAAATTAELVATLELNGDAPHAEKIHTRSQVVELVDRWRQRGLTVGFTNGCFDLLHPGHVTLLEKARAMVDRLVVGLNSDLSVSRLKGPGRPVQSEVARASVLASLRSVDAVVVFPEDTPLELIRELRPQVLVKGGDYSRDTVVGAGLVESWGGRVELVELVEDQSTTRVIERMHGSRGR
jgi:D-beta-D-heptose 7-phosphate kinase / D-beta-D-heptose 1-phosphate adenosyltransferase